MQKDAKRAYNENMDLAIISEVSATDLLLRLAVALGGGLLIGLERGWQHRDQPEGGRIAGIRTFGLIALAGGLTTLLAGERADILLAAGILALAGLFGIGYRKRIKTVGDYGVTTPVAAIVTLGLGAAAGAGALEVSAAGAVVVTLLLGIKPELHHLLERLEQREMLAVIKLLLISVVLLPVLPDQGFGPWQALNPYRIWWMVVLVAAISSVGYFAVRVLGERLGVLSTGLFGGLASSTPTVLALARRSAVSAQGGRKPAVRLLAAGALLACTMTYLRILVVLAVVSPPAATLALSVLLPAAFGTGVLALLAGRIEAAVAPDQEEEGAQTPAGNPFEMKVALQFGVLLALIMLMAAALKSWAGAQGLYVLAAVSGLVDVDAITLSLAALVQDGALAARDGLFMILTAAAVNNLVKAGLALSVGARSYGLWVTAGLVLGLLCGLAAAMILYLAPLSGLQAL